MAFEPRIPRRNLRKGLLVAGCLFGTTSTPGAAIGLTLLGVGAGLHFVSKGTLRQNRELTRSGPYRYTRNPFYLANALIDLGILCLIT